MKRELLRIYRNHIRLGFLYQIATALFALPGAYLLSELLTMVQVREVRTGRILADIICITAAAAVIGFLYRLHLKASQESLLKYRTFICESVIDGHARIMSVGEMDVRLGKDADTISNYYGNVYPRFLAGRITALVCVILFCWYDSLLTFLFILLAMLQFFPALLYEKWARTIYRQSALDLESYSDWVNEGLRGISTIKAYRMEGWFMRRFGSYRKAVVSSGNKENDTAAVEDVVSALISGLLTYGSYLILGAFALAGRVTVGALPFLLMLMEQLFDAALVLAGTRVEKARLNQAVERMENVWKESEGEKRKKVISKRQKGVKNKQWKGSGTENKSTATCIIDKTAVVSVQNISKSYGDKTVLSEASVEISEGEHILLRGENGSGKTTLMKIMLGLDTPDTGIVRPATEAAFAFQEEPVLHLHMRELMEELIQSSAVDEKQFYRHLTGFHLENLYDSELTECSVGQRKKFYLSAALARKTDLLVLDEPTNHLDRDGVSWLYAALQDMNTAWLVCTHDERLTALENRSYEVREGVVHEIFK